MLSPKTQTNLKNAKGYFEEHLCLGDYYDEGTRIRGEWLGEGAALLGLSGVVESDAFLALCGNLHPGSGKRLTQRQNCVRRGLAAAEAEEANRRVFYDFTFSPPKSVSIVALVAADERVVLAHRAAVKTALRELERFAAARIRAAGQNVDRRTSNIIAAMFEHETSRALDPHLHTHCVVFNATHDPDEERWKALQNYDMLAAQKFAENVYYHELARALRNFGYTVKNSARGDFELAEIAPDLRERFSKRHREIDEKTRAFLEQYPAEHARSEMAVREYIAHKERARKPHDANRETLRRLWDSQLSTAEKPVVRRADEVKVAVAEALTATDAVTWAEDHLFERRAVVREHELWRHALAFARGWPVSVQEIQMEVASRRYLRSGIDKIGNPQALEHEWALVEAARNGVGQHPILAPAPEFDPQAAPDQWKALNRLLSSTSFITLFRGGAGTGKSFVLERLQRKLDDSGQASLVLAPQRQQVLDLKRDGLHDAQTVNECVQRAILPTGVIVIVDEAGQIGARQLYALVRLVEKHGGRLILSGDTRQHGPVEASDALRAIERYAGLWPAELKEIRRQDPRRGTNEEERKGIAGYQNAVRAAADGDSSRSFDQLDALGAVVECAAGEHTERLSEAYVGISAKGESAIVVSQTRAEVRNLNESIRQRLRDSGILSGQEVEIVTLEQVDLSGAQKREARFYSAESVLVFNRDFRGCRKSQQGRLLGFSSSGIVMEVAGKVWRVPLENLDSLSICRPQALALCTGDQLQLKSNGKALNGRKLANGEVVTVAAIEESGVIHLRDGRKLPPSYRQFQRGYAVTSYGSQGKTVDHVLLGDSAVRTASNAQQWYVSISRGRKSVRIFTPDKMQLREAIRRTGTRELALDLIDPSSFRRSLPGRFARSLVKGRELARLMCRIAMHVWATKFVRTTQIQEHETTHRTA